jgi:hypothetical protein
MRKRRRPREEIDGAKFRQILGKPTLGLPERLIGERRD